MGVVCLCLVCYGVHCLQWWKVREEAGLRGPGNGPSKMYALSIIHQRLSLDAYVCQDCILFLSFSYPSSFLSSFFSVVAITNWTSWPGNPSRSYLWKIQYFVLPPTTRKLYRIVVLFCVVAKWQTCCWSKWRSKIDGFFMLIPSW